MNRNYDSRREGYRPRDYDRTHRDQRNITQRRDFIPQQPPMIPQPIPSQPQLQPPPKQPDVQEPIRSLIETKGKLKDLVLLANQRKFLVQLFSGLPHESWFLLEVIESFPILVSRRAGANFIYSINHKIREPFLPWINKIMENMESLMEFNNGALTYYDLIPFLSRDQLVTLTNYCWSIYQTKYDESHMTLYIRLIQYLRNDLSLLEPLFNVDWTELKNHQEMVVNLIANVPSQTDNLYMQYSNAIAGMTQAVDFVHTICAFLEYGSLSVREQIFGVMISSINDLALRDPSWNVLSMMIVVGTNERRKLIGNALFQIIENNSVLPTHFDVLLTRLLMAYTLPDRLSYISRLTPYIDKLMKPKFLEMLKYMYCLLSE